MIIPVPESIAGFGRSLYYSEKVATELLETHQALAGEFKVQAPYYDFTNTGQESYVDVTLANDVSLKIGPIGAFTAHEMAAVLNEQVSIYVLLGTMGRNYPLRDKKANEELVAEMMGGFDADRVVVLFSKQRPGGVAPLASVQAYRGRSENLVAGVLRGEAMVPSTISTLVALRASKQGLESAAFLNFVQKWGHVTESDTVGMSRLMKLENELLRYHGVTEEDMAWKAMACLVPGVIISALEREVEPPKLFVYDTHTKGIQRNLTEKFGMVEILNPGQVIAQPAVKNTILRYHYGAEGVAGDWLEDIRVGAVSSSDYLAGALNYLLQLGIDTKPWQAAFMNVAGEVVLEV